MSKYFIFFFALSACYSVTANTNKFDPIQNDLNPIPDFNINSYLGNWHEIAAIPASFQKNCFKDTTAHYELNTNNGLIKVKNSCLDKDGDLIVANGLARRNPNYSLASQLQVSFVSLLGKPIWRFGGNYWVLELGSNYEYSLIGEPSYKFAWILSRTPVMDKKTLEQISRTLLEQGYDPCKLLMSRNSTNNLSVRLTLCEYISN